MRRSMYPAGALVTIVAGALAFSGSAFAATPTARYGFVEHSVVVRSAPHGSPVGYLKTVTSDGTSMLVEPVESFQARGGWIRVRFPALPTDRTGWIPAWTLSPFTPVYDQVIVDQERLRLTLLAKGRVALSVPIGVGKPSTPTPRGSFYVLDRLNVSEGAYAPVAFGTSARSEVLTEWPGGGVIGIHGDLGSPQLIPGRPSHGCIRLRTSDIIRLARLLPIGTPITIR